MKLLKTTLIVICMLVAQRIHAQVLVIQPTKGEFPAYIDANGDTIAVVFLPSITISSKRVFKTKRDQNRYNKLYYNVLKAYPLAKVAGKRLQELEAALPSIPEHKRQKHIKGVEEDLKKKYKQDLLNLTVSQGKILIKLIDRETSRTGYEVIKEFRGGFQAFMWQSLAGLFGTNLKTGYDDQEDRDIELILQDIEGDRYQPPYKYR
jgi:hypothetical protein